MFNCSLTEDGRYLTSLNNFKIMSDSPVTRIATLITGGVI